ncbi:hypothetical protein BC830DRAFT_1079248 [Chytriomyces sp. MP71]|nr:hypothetical protein BC830DRAFT_1079248 [Chytriomyces sp. MP71]
MTNFEARFDEFICLLLTAKPQQLGNVLIVVAATESIVAEVEAGCEDADANHVAILAKQCGSWLQRADDALLLSSDPNAYEASRRVKDIRSRLKTLASRSAATERPWVLSDRVALRVRELPFGEAAFGWQTWAGGALFALLLECGQVDIGSHSVLELGCGTGIVGIAASKLHLPPSHVTMTDFQATILENAARNARANNCSAALTVRALDWAWITPSSETTASPMQPAPPESVGAFPSLDLTTRFHTIIGADICYEHAHADLVPRVCESLLLQNSDAAVHLITTLRGDMFGVTRFEERMLECGFETDLVLDYEIQDVLGLTQGRVPVETISISGTIAIEG